MLSWGKGRSAVDDDHLSTGLVGFHEPMRLLDLLEVEDASRLHVEAAGCRKVSAG
jgi:hypothetical protein